VADTKRLAEFRKALVAAHRKADSAVTAAWRARRDAYHLSVEAAQLAPTIANEGLRTAIETTTKKLAEDTAAAENAASDRRSQVGELLDLLGGAKER
jgi:hypothetical protein